MLRMLAILGIEFVAMAIIVGVVITQAHTYTARTRIVGILCIIFGSAMYASPLTVMKKVITTKSVKYMPFFISLTNFLNGICWTLYALIKFNLNMVIPNGLGAFFGAVQLILFGCFYRTTVWDEKDDDKANSEIQNFALFLFLLLLRKGGHSHSHNHPMEKMAVAGLILVPALSPYATTLPVFLAVGNSSSMMVLAIIVLLIRE